MKATEMKGKSEAELVELERELRDELFRLRMKHFTGQLQRVSELREKRRDIARVLTVISQMLRDREQQLLATASPSMSATGVGPNGTFGIEERNG